MRDKLYQEFEVGDYVAFNPPYNKGIKIGKIKRLTPKGVTIIYEDGPFNTKKECNRPARQCIVITEQIAKAKENNPEYFL